MDIPSSLVFDDKPRARIPGNWPDSSAELSDTDTSRVTGITPNRPRSETTPNRLAGRKERHASLQTVDHYDASHRESRNLSNSSSPCSEFDDIFDRSSISRASTPSISPSPSPSTSTPRLHDKDTESRGRNPRKSLLFKNLPLSLEKEGRTALSPEFGVTYSSNLSPDSIPRKRRLTSAIFANPSRSTQCPRLSSPSPLSQSRTSASSTLDSPPSRTRRTSAQRPTSTLQDLGVISDLQLGFENDTIVPPSRSEEQETDLDANPSGEVGFTSDTTRDPDRVPGFRPFKNKLKLLNSINNDIFRLIRRRELEKKINAGKVVPSYTDLGYIYIFTLPSCPGFVKIGMTKQVPQVRVSKQEYDCKLPYDLVEDPHDKPFKGYRAVEKLIMAELHNLRREFVCSNCKGTRKQAARKHGEWYEISEEKALGVIERWRQWMVMGEPYGANGVLTPFWVWKYDEQIRDLEKVRWEEWLYPPSPLNRFRYYLSLMIKGGSVCCGVLYRFWFQQRFQQREDGRRWSRWEHLCNGASVPFWLVFVAFWYLSGAWFGWIITMMGMMVVAAFVL